METIKRKVKIEPYRIDWICPFCKKGYMLVTEKKVPAPLTIPNRKQQQFYLVHQCTSCKAEKSIADMYPKIENEVIIIEDEKVIKCKETQTNPLKNTE